jgi:hypothetical protein
VKYGESFHPDGIAQQKHSMGQAGQAKGENTKEEGVT